jgi:hypothetical protein
LLAESILFACFVASPLIAAERPLKDRDVVLFDPGPADSALEDGTIKLTHDSDYTPTIGFGWSNRPHQAFERPGLARSRTAWTIDGVAGKQFGFRADVDPGTWHVTLWLEASQTNGAWPQIAIQDEQRALHWQVFRPNDEPEDALDKVYRVFHCATSVGPEGLHFELVGGESEVRLLGISLVKRVDAAKPEHHDFLARVQAIGRDQAGEPLNGLLQQAEASLRENPTDAFYAIWRQRLAMLADAERYYTLRGWQSADEATGMGMFDRQYQAAMLLDALLTPNSDESHALADRAMYTRGKLLYWMAKEQGGVHEIAGAKRDLEALAKKYPNDEILAMYAGAQIDVPDPCDCLAPTVDAPAWSVAQREALCRLRELVHWWVNERQNAQGELGGKLRDDVEMLRWWAPLCLAGDTTAIQGWKKLADGVWQSKYVSDGYAKRIEDVEHAAEFIADTAPLMLVLSDKRRYAERLAYSAKHFESTWTGTKPNGNRFFFSAWFSASDLETDEPKGRDLEYNTRAVQPMRYLAWRHPDPKLVTLLHEWSTSWAEAAMRTDKGKPKGLIPASIRFVDEAFNGDGPNWYRADMHWDYFEWEHFAGALMLDQLLFTYTLTNDERLLEPMFLHLELIRSNELAAAGNEGVAPEEGSAAWAAAVLARSSDFWNVVEQWRFLTGDPRWDELITRHGTSYGRYRIDGDERHLVKQLHSLLNEVRYNTPLRTTEAMHTDRLYVPHVEFLKAMLTGDGIWGNLSPYYAVSWEKTDDNFTALVRNARPNRLEIDLFSHAMEDREIIMRVWQLEAGKYWLNLDANASDSRPQAVIIAERGQRIAIKTPSRRLLRIRLVHAGRINSRLE